jgi:hypothetical protein
VTRQIGERTANRLQIVLIPLDGSADVVKSAAGLAPVWLVGS